MEVLNPSTGEVIAEVARSTAEDADRAVEAAKNALPEWLDSTPGERPELLFKLADLIEDHIPLVSEMPHGGYKESGNGKDLSVYSLEDYTQIKHVMAKID
jgi:acyl-CoA reductase-like NAD-dependent aldehyde dehydrogenase